MLTEDVPRGEASHPHEERWNMEKEETDKFPQKKNGEQEEERLHLDLAKEGHTLAGTLRRHRLRG